MIRLICRITGNVVWIPTAWTSWTIGNLHFARITVGAGRRVIQWRQRGAGRWRALEIEPAVERCREQKQRQHWEPVAKAS